MNAIVLSFAVLDEARLFFEKRGAFGCEGTAMIALNEGTASTRLVIPDQVAEPLSWVEVTPRGKLELAAALALEEQYIARIHSHPGEAFHSRTDNENPGLTHEGALSIVAPYFGLGLRRGFDATAVYIRRGLKWVELPIGPIRNAHVMVK